MIVLGIKKPSKQRVVYFDLLERVRRIELPSQPWQGRVLPLYHTRKINGGPDGTRTRDLLRDRQAC